MRTPSPKDDAQDDALAPGQSQALDALSMFGCLGSSRAGLLGETNPGWANCPSRLFARQAPPGLDSFLSLENSFYLSVPEFVILKCHLALRCL